MNEDRLENIVIKDAYKSGKPEIRKGVYLKNNVITNYDMTVGLLGEILCGCQCVDHDSCGYQCGCECVHYSDSA